MESGWGRGHQTQTQAVRADTDLGSHLDPPSHGWGNETQRGVATWQVTAGPTMRTREAQIQGSLEPHGLLLEAPHLPDQGQEEKVWNSTSPGHGAKPLTQCGAGPQSMGSQRVRHD